MGWKIGGSNPGRGKGFLSSPSRPDRLWCPASLLLFKGYKSSFSVAKRPGHDVYPLDHSSPSIAEVKNK
jgi:hypothetical protein